jgi:hypothetical protein
MSHEHIIRPHAKRPIAALLVIGSMMGFVMGQQLGHPARKHSAHTPSQTSGVVAHAAGNLGKVPAAAPQSVAVHASAPANTPAPQPEQKLNEHHGNGESGQGGSVSQSDGNGDLQRVLD